ncbi:MerR family transcriptional regulator [Chelatococcus asaccharovorans]|uniref:MerR family transcriptional regulator n=1 Tax=Chelatococcus asaccharovorans TaxID=28210 RepID=UPI00224C662C|nr:MerR family transcriptional regulator [Chelatococcus asaccharovorans]CAH1668588.1 MerR-like DNA binding protein [Chelatococcus asaccharovorans]CAH1679989.1 MerR-like DNA binding protein [Chelatococcus asaccharovorans]
MDKGPDAFRTISEVGEELDVPQHVLRFWETRFTQIKPLKRGGGRRYYRPDDVELLRGIRHLLYGEGYTIKGVQRILKQEGVRFVQQVWQEPQQLSSLGAGQRFIDDFEEAAETDEARDDRVPPDAHGHHDGRQNLEAAWQNTPTMPLADDDLLGATQAGPRTYQLRHQNHEALRGPDTPRDVREQQEATLNDADDPRSSEAFAAMERSGLDEASLTRLSMVLDDLRECRRLIAIARGVVDDEGER